MSFYTFMMRKYKGTNTPEGDLAYDMEFINHSEDMRQELHAMTDAELIAVFNGFIEEMEV